MRVQITELWWIAKAKQKIRIAKVMSFDKFHFHYYIFFLVEGLKGLDGFKGLEGCVWSW